MEDNTQRPSASSVRKKQSVTTDMASLTQSRKKGGKFAWQSMG
jgi:hypothetical protein